MDRVMGQDLPGSYHISEGGEFEIWTKWVSHFDFDWAQI